jgi:hypothetical protein
LLGTNAFSHAARELSFEHIGSDTWLEMDADGDGLADMAVLSTGSIKPVAADFILSAARPLKRDCDRSRASPPDEKLENRPDAQ